MVTDFQIVNEEQKTFLKEIKKEILLTPLLYKFLRGWEYSIQVSKKEMSHLKTHEKPIFHFFLKTFLLLVGNLNISQDHHKIQVFYGLSNELSLVGKSMEHSRFFPCKNFGYALPMWQR